MNFLKLHFSWDFCWVRDSIINWLDFFSFELRAFQILCMIYSVVKFNFHFHSNKLTENCQHFFLVLFYDIMRGIDFLKNVFGLKIEFFLQNAEKL